MNDATGPVRHILIYGSGPEATAAAAALAVSLRGGEFEISLVIPTDGPGSVGIERIRGGEQAFHRRLGIDEQELLRATSGAYCLGTRFMDFRGGGESAFVPLGSHGMTLRLVPFHQYWCHLHASGCTEPYNDYSLPAVAATRGRFVPPTNGDDPVLATWSHDLLVDPDLITHYYRDVARKLGVAIVRGDVAECVLDSQGFINAIRLQSGGEYEADIFIDSSADRTIIGALAGAEDFDDWSPCLPCDRMISALTPKQGNSRLYSVTRALDHGWLEQDTLQQFDVDTLAYCSRDVDDGDAKALLEKNMKSAPVSTSAIRRWRSGCYRRPWIRNCIAIGPADVTVEPLIVTSLQLACNAILRLLGMLPASRNNPMLATEFNRITAEERGGVRNYTLLHYQLARRPASPFWCRSRAEASLPQTLLQRMQLFSSIGRLSVGENEGFTEARWIATLINFGVLPASVDPLVEMAEAERVQDTLQAFRERLRRASNPGNGP